MKKIMITGATDGLGAALAEKLASEGNYLILHGRNESKLNNYVDKLTGKYSNSYIKSYVSDFASMNSIKKMCNEIIENESALDIIVNNAGLGVEDIKRVSDDNVEMLFQVNFLSNYIIINKLHKLLESSQDPRIINVASAGQANINFDDVMLEEDWSGMQSYGQSKVAQIMLAMEYGEKLKSKGINVNALHPASMMPTKIVTHMFTPMSSICDGVNSLMYQIKEDYLRNVSGKYFFETSESAAIEQVYDTSSRKKLIKIAEDLTGLKF